jgi:hypothetical protein
MRFQHADLEQNTLARKSCEGQRLRVGVIQEHTYSTTNKGSSWQEEVRSQLWFLKSGTFILSAMGIH